MYSRWLIHKLFVYSLYFWCCSQSILENRKEKSNYDKDVKNASEKARNSFWLRQDLISKTNRINQTNSDIFWKIFDVSASCLFSAAHQSPNESEIELEFHCERRKVIVVGIHNNNNEKKRNK